MHIHKISNLLLFFWSYIYLYKVLQRVNKTFRMNGSIIYDSAAVSNIMAKLPKNLLSILPTYRSNPFSEFSLWKYGLKQLIQVLDFKGCRFFRMDFKGNCLASRNFWSQNLE